MLMMPKRLTTCCSRSAQLSIDFDELPDDNRIMTYDGLESCILNSHSCINESEMNREEECVTDSLDDDATSCSSSNAFTSCASHWKDNQKAEAWDGQESLQFFHTKEKPAYVFEVSDADSMKEIFSKLLLGEDVSGGTRGLPPALALSNAITNLAASTFGELWKLEPLSEEKKNRWKKEIDWFISPANYMIELVPAKQSSANGRIIEIMAPKTRSDVHMNLPALQKLDSMLMDTLDSMMKSEFWYSEGSIHCKDQVEEGCDSTDSKRWWLPYPRVPPHGLSEFARKKLVCRGNVVHQVFKASKSINENILSEMPVPQAVKDALPKSGREITGEKLYSILGEESSSAIDMADFLRLNSDHEALDTINKLESAQLVWRDRIEEQGNVKFSVRKPWPFAKDPSCKTEKTESLLFRLETLLRELRMRYPYLPHTFLDMTKIQYSKDVGHLIMESYSRVLVNLSYNILSRIGDILQEDHLSNPTTPAPLSCFQGNGMLVSPKWKEDAESPEGDQRSSARRSLMDQMSQADSHSYFTDSNPSMRSSDLDISSSEARSSCSIMATPSASRIWCVGGDACSTGTPCSSPWLLEPEMTSFHFWQLKNRVVSSARTSNAASI